MAERGRHPSLAAPLLDLSARPGFCNQGRTHPGFVPTPREGPQTCSRRVRSLSRRENQYSGSKITTPVLGWLEDSVVRSGSPGFGVAESFSRCADTWIVC